MSTPNYKSWTPKILKEIINRCNNQAMIYFDINTRNNLQNKYFASIELGSQLKKNKGEINESSRNKISSN